MDWRRVQLGLRRGAMALVGTGVLLSIAACSSSSPSDPVALSCENGRFTGQVVDYDGGSTLSPEEAISAFVAGPGSGLPTDGYTEASPSTNLTSPSSIRDRSGGTTVSSPTKLFVHLDDNRPNVTLTLAQRGEGWQVDEARYCPSAKN